MILIGEWLLSNLWRAACLLLILACAAEHWRANHWHGKYDAQVAENALAADANAASQSAIASLRKELEAANARAVAYAANVEAVERARAAQAAKDAAKLAEAQRALDAALGANKDWAATPVPPEVRKALN